MLLYHGTNARYLPSILEFGLRPRGDDVGNYGGIQASSQQLVYLSDRNPIWYSSKAFSDQNEKQNGTVLLLEVDVDEEALFPDEDFLRQDIARLNYGETFTVSQLEPFSNQERMAESLDQLGSVGHFGMIPPASIIRYALVNVRKGHQLLEQACDVERATIENFTEHLERYQTITSFIFNGLPYQGRDLNHLWKHAIRVYRNSARSAEG